MKSRNLIFCDNETLTRKWYCFPDKLKKEKKTSKFNKGLDFDSEYFYIYFKNFTLFCYI